MTNASSGRSDSSQPEKTEPFSLGQRATVVKRPVISPGMMLDNFRLEEPIGRGGMGEVWKAWDSVAQRAVVIKVLPPELLGFPEAMDQVRETFARIHSLQHQHICPVYMLGFSEACGYYVVMKFVPGHTLSAWRRHQVARDGRVDALDVVRILESVAQALDYAHRQKIIHRDIKPQNILISPDGQDVQVIDFGLAVEIRTSMTRISRVRMDSSGTYPYMAPEQWRGAYQDAKTDQYALGILAFELLTGRLPFEAPDENILRACVLNDPLPQPDGMSAAVYAVLSRATARERTDRFEDCIAFVRALRTAFHPDARNAKSSEKEAGSSPKPTTQDVPKPSRISPPTTRTGTLVVPDRTGATTDQKITAAKPATSGSGASWIARLFGVGVVAVAAILLLQFAQHRGLFNAEVARLPASGQAFALVDDNTLMTQIASPDNPSVQELVVYNVSNGEAIRRFASPPNAARCIKTAGVGKCIVGFQRNATDQVANGSELLKLYDVLSGTEIRSFSGHLDSILAIGTSADGGWFVSSSDDGTLRRWNTETGQIDWQITLREPATAISLQAMDALGSFHRLLVGTRDGMILTVDSHTGEIRRESSTGFAARINDIDQQMFSRIAWISVRNTLVRWDADTGSPDGPPVSLTAEIMTAAPSPVSQYVLIGGFDFHTRLMDPVSGSELRDFRQHGVVGQVEFSSSGRTAFAADAAGGITVWRMPDS